MGWDSATFWDTGTEVPLLSWDKGQRDKLKILPRDKTSQDSQNLGWDGMGQPKSTHHITDLGCLLSGLAVSACRDPQHL